jgi:hypothetical protein
MADSGSSFSRYRIATLRHSSLLELGEIFAVKPVRLNRTIRTRAMQMKAKAEITNTLFVFIL